MATGIEMLMKSFGVDPEQLKQSLINARDEIIKKQDEINERLTRIELKLDEYQSSILSVDEAIGLTNSEELEYGGRLDSSNNGRTN
jgi:hypothetical protein